MRTYSLVYLITLASCNTPPANHQDHSSSQAPVSRDLMLNDTQIRLANVTTQRVTKKPIGLTVTINGKLAVDEQRSEVISSRAAGRVEKLFVKETGLAIKRGEPLYILYSETLLTLQQEYLLAKEQYETLGKSEARYKSFFEAAEKKLLLYGLTKNQIRQLTGKDALQPRITFVAPVSGVVTGINAAEGQYVEEGGLLYTIEDLSSLWIEAELYPDETKFVRTGDLITARISGDENSNVEAKVTFLSPEYRLNSQITTMRAAIENREGRYRPGQMVYITVMHSSKEAYTLPVDAVIRDGKGTHIYVEAGDNTFHARMVKTGIENADQVEIVEGIAEGDTVVVSGAYLLYSEFILKRGTDPMAGHGH
jgi:membrane fusion protein, copper/silver efflux system